MHVDFQDINRSTDGGKAPFFQLILPNKIVLFFFAFFHIIPTDHIWNILRELQRRTYLLSFFCVEHD